MKIPLLFFSLMLSIIATAQDYKQRLQEIYTSFLDIKSYGIKIDPDSIRNKTSKYTSFKVERYDKGKDVWNKGDSVVIFYDDRKRVSQKLIYQWSRNIYLRFIKAEIINDANGNPESVLRYRWNKYEKAWQLFGKVHYMVNQNWRQISMHDEVWNEQRRSWKNNSSEVYYFDCRGNDSLTVKQFWDDSAGLWLDNERIVKDFDSNGYLVSKRFDFHNLKTATWDESSMLIYTYDSAGKEVSRFDDMRMEHCYENFDFYDLAGRQEEIRQYAWRNKEGRWVYFGATKWYYANLGDMKYSSQFLWTRIPNTDSVELSCKTLQTFNSDSNLVSVTCMKKRNVSWYIESYDSAVYESRDNLVYLYHEFENASSACQIFFYDKDYGRSSEDEPEVEQVDKGPKIFPNPSTGTVVNLLLQEEKASTLVIKLLDAAGDLITSETRVASGGNNTFELHYPGLPPAIYYIEVFNQETGEKNSLKWIVQ